MASILDDIIDFSQLQPAPGTSLAPSTPGPMPQNPPLISDNDEESSDSEGDDDQQVIRTPSSTLELDPPDAVTAFAISAARDLGLTANGEKSLLQFSRVFFFFHPMPATVLTAFHRMPRARCEVGSDLPASDAHQTERNLLAPCIRNNRVRSR